MEGSVEIVLFPSTYNALAKYLVADQVVFVSGKVNMKDERISVIVDDMKFIHEVYGSIKSINVSLKEVQDDALKSLRQKLTHFPGKIPVYLHLNTAAQKGVQIRVGEGLYVSPNENLMNEIKELVGKENFSVTF